MNRKLCYNCLKEVATKEDNDTMPRGYGGHLCYRDFGIECYVEDSRVTQELLELKSKADRSDEFHRRAHRLEGAEERLVYLRENMSAEIKRVSNQGYSRASFAKRAYRDAVKQVVAAGVPDYVDGHEDNKNYRQGTLSILISRLIAQRDEARKGKSDMNELKIIYGKNGSHCKVYVGDTQIGCIQEVKSVINTNDCDIEVTLLDPELNGLSESLKKECEFNLKLLQSIPFIKIKLTEV
jgi:hypothetical protein